MLYNFLKIAEGKSEASVGNMLAQSTQGYRDLDFISAHLYCILCCQKW
jgi:hypothetical protein